MGFTNKLVFITVDNRMLIKGVYKTNPPSLRVSVTHDST